MIMSQEFYVVSLISVIAVISFSTLFASNLIEIKDYSRVALRVFRFYFIFGFIGWLFFGLVEFSSFSIGLSWLAIAYILASSMLFFILLGQVHISYKSVAWLISNTLFIVMVLVANTVEAELWAFTTYVLIHFSILCSVALVRGKRIKNIGFDIISLAVFIPVGLAVGQAYLLFNQYDLGIVVGLGILGAATSYSLVGLGFIIMMLVMERNSYEAQANKDELTGIYNRRGLNSALEYIVAKSFRESSSVAAIICDIDFFKKVNDTHGHDVGDIVLKEFSNLLKNMQRASDLVARIGGEEFILVLPNTNNDEAEVLAERIRKEIEGMNIMIPNGSVKLTASFGVSCQKNEIDIDTLYKYADKALYEAKSSGRNKVCRNMGFS